MVYVMKDQFYVFNFDFFNKYIVYIKQIITSSVLF